MNQRYTSPNIIILIRQVFLGMLESSTPVRSERKPNSTMPTLPSLGTTSQFLQGKLPAMSMAEFKPTATLNPYTVMPPIGAPMDKFKNHTEVWEILQKIRQQELELPEVNPQPKLKPVKLLAHGEHSEHYENDSFELDEDNRADSMSARAEKDLSEEMFFCESGNLGFSLPDISKYRHLTAPKISLESEDNRAREKDNPSFRTVASVQGEGTKCLEAQFVDGIMRLTHAQPNRYLADFGACAASHPQERHMSSHGHDPTAYPQRFYWSTEQRGYMETGEEQRWQKHEPTAHAQRFYWNTGEIDDYMGTGQEQQWQNRDPTVHDQRFYLSAADVGGYVGTGDEQHWQNCDPTAHDQRSNLSVGEVGGYVGTGDEQLWQNRDPTAHDKRFNLSLEEAGGYVGTRDEQLWQNRDPIAHDQRFNLSVGEVGGYVGTGDEQRWKKLSKRMTLTSQESDEEEEDEEEDRQEKEKAEVREAKAQKKPFLRLLMERIRRKKNPPRTSAPPSEHEHEQSSKSYTEYHELF